MINYSLAKEIYGLNAWCVDAFTLPAMTSILRNVENGVVFSVEDVKLNTPSIIQVESKDTKIITRPYGDGWTAGQLDNNDDFHGIGVININGAITVSGGASSMGMQQVSSISLKMAADKRIKSFIMPINSGGGSSTAVEIMSDTVKKIRSMGKDVVAVITKGGNCCSAAYGIATSASMIYSESKMNIVGSIGTMVQFEGREANTTDENGVKHIRVYATKSVAKNKAFEDALNKNDYTLLVNDLLDPVNDEFISMIENNRPLVKGSKDFDNGQTMFSKDAIGTFIDGIKSFDEVVSDLTSSNNTNINNKQMNKSELQSKYPELYQEVYNEGAKSEKVRVGSWMAHAETDLPAVKAGIKSGEALEADQREEFLVKAQKQVSLNQMQKDSAPDINAAGAEQTISEEASKNEEINKFYENL